MLNHKEDFYVPFKETNHNNPYDNPVLHKVEDILGYKLTFSRLDPSDIRYLKTKRKELKQDVCDCCVRLQNESISNADEIDGYGHAGLARCGGCRIFKVKQTLTRVANGHYKEPVEYIAMEIFKTRFEHLKAIFGR